jgi:aminopeptidase
MPSNKNQEWLHKYAELVIHVGLNLRSGQRLIIHNGSTRGVPLHVAPLIREIVRSAYKAGARYVDVIWNDEELLRTRAQLAPRDSMKEYSTWHVHGLIDMIEKGDAMLTIRSNNPALLSDLDPDIVGEWQQTHAEYFEPVLKAATSNKINWCVISAASPAWAGRIFPKLTPKAAEAKLWKAIFEITRLDQSNPVRAWEKHIKNLTMRAEFLTARRYTRLVYKAPGTDLTIGLPQGHKWIAAKEHAQNGIDFCANIPTEEVFTLPHCDKVDGRVTASLPLSYGGSLIKNFSLSFEKGRVTRVSAKSGESLLNKLVRTDEGAARLGEVSLVPQSSPIAQKKMLFYDTLIDENAASHIAIGHAIQSCLENSDRLTDEEFRQQGGNISITHVDFMIGSEKMDIDGTRDDGTHEPIMRRGEWAFKI